MVLGPGGDLGSARGQIIIDTGRSSRNIRALQGDLATLDQRTGRTTKNATTAAYGMAGIGLAIAGGFGFAINAAANFEQAMSNVAAVADDTGGGIDALRQKALDLGRETAFSATESALAIEELAKLGLSTAEIMGGAVDGVVALAAAAGTSMPIAASLIGTALNQFSLGADQATRVADLLAAAAAKSAVDATDVGEALSYVGGQAAAAGIPIEDVVAAIAAMGDQGIIGSRAGTSLTQAITSLINPSGTAREKMDELGIAVADAQGNIKSLPDILENVATATANLSEEERLLALNRIFGEQGGRAILALLKTQGAEAEAAGQSWDDYSEAVQEQGAAAEQAEIRMDNFRGSLEELKGSVETLAITFGSVLLPIMRGAVDALTAVLNAVLGMGDGFAKVFVGVAGGVGIIAALGAGFALLGPHLRQAAAGIQLIFRSIALLALANPLVLAIVVAIGALTAAYATNFGGFADWVNGVLGAFGRFITNFRAGLDIFTTTRGLVEGTFAALGSALQEATGLPFFTVFENMGKVAARISTAFRRIQSHVRAIGRIFDRGGLKAGFDSIFGREGQKILANFGDVFGAVPRIMGTALRGIETGIRPLDRILENAGGALQQFGRSIENVFAGDFERAQKNMQNFGRRLRTIGSTLGGLLVDLGSFLVDAAPEAAGALWEFMQNVGGWIWDGLTWIGGKLVELGRVAIDAVPEAAGALWTMLQDVGGWIWTQVKAGTSRLIDLGRILIDAAAELGGDLAVIAANVGGWLRTKLLAGAQALVDIGRVGVTAALNYEESKDEGGFAGVAGSIADGVVNAVRSLADLGSRIADGIVDLMLDFSWRAELFGSGVDIGAAIRGWVIAGVQAITSTDWEDVAITIFKGISASLLASPAAGLTLASALASFMAGLFVGLTFGDDPPDLGKLAAEIVLALIDALSAVQDFATRVFTAIVDTLTAGLTTDTFTGLAASIASKLWDAVVQWFRDHTDIGEIVDAITGDADPQEGAEAAVRAGLSSRPSGGGGAGFGGGFEPEFFLPESIRRPDALSGAMADAFAGLVTASQTTGDTAGEDLRVAMAAKMTALAQDARTQTATYRGAVDEGLRGTVTVAVAAAQQIQRALTLPSMFPAGQFIGASLGQGIVAGIGSQIAAAANAARNLVRAVIDAAQREGEITSPSRRARREIGQPIGQGVGLGILDEMRFVREAMAALIGGNTSLANVSNTAGNLPAFAPSGGGGTITINNTTIALRSDELEHVIQGAEQGFEANAFVQQATNSVRERMNTTRRWT